MPDTVMSALQSLTRLSSQQPYEVGTMITPFYRGKTQAEKVNDLPKPPASKWQSEDLKPGNLASESGCKSVCYMASSILGIPAFQRVAREGQGGITGSVNSGSFNCNAHHHRVIQS